MKKFILAFSFLFCANFANAQEVLPPKPKGPSIKADAIENYEWAKDLKTKDSKTMIAAYKAGEYKNALSLAIALSEKGDTNATALAGYLYEMGLGMEAPDFDNAAKFYRLAYSKGSIDAMVGLGRMASHNQGGIGIIEATNALEAALKAKRSDAAMPLADILINNNIDRKRGFSLYQRLAAAGDIEGAYKAAILLDDGEEMPIDDPISASTYLKQAALGGVIQAQADYGLFLYQGRGIEKNLEEAVKWFKLSAENGDEDGAFYWALVNAKGEGVPRNLEIAKKYAEIAKPYNRDAQKLYDQLIAAANKK